MHSLKPYDCVGAVQSCRKASAAATSYSAVSEPTHHICDRTSTGNACISPEI